jgi:putative ABC transport system permease protein
MLTVLRQALRALLRSPGFTLAAVATFALGIGANATVFGVVNAVLLKAYPFAEPARLVALYETNIAGEMGPEAGRFPIAPANFHDWQQQAKAFTAMAAVGGTEFTLRGDGEPERLGGSRVTWALPRVLGVAPQVGRAFTPDDDRPGAPPVVMISDRLWRTRFGGDRGVAGRVVDLNGRPTTIIGVLPAGVRYPNARTDVWGPFAMSDSAWTGQRGNHSIQAVARLASGVSVEQATTELHAIATRIAAEYPDFQRDFRATAVPLHDALTGPVRPVLLVLLGAVAFVLLIACTNVANLTLARGAARQREVAVRTAIGASRWHLVRQQLAESVVLGAVGAGLGLGLASLACAALPAVVPADIPRLDEAGIDGRVAAFTLALALLASIAAGVVPALQTARTDLNGVLKDGGKNATGGAARARIRDGLFVAEVAFALLLMTGAGLALTSLSRLLSVAPGFAPERVLTAQLALPRARYASDTAQAAFYAQLLPRLRAIPGVAHAGLASGLPLGGGMAYGSYLIDGKPVPSPQDAPLADFAHVSGDYFRAMGVPVRRGRDFAETDRFGQGHVAIVSEALVREQFRGEDPIGRHVQPWGPEGPKFQVVGVVADVKQHSLADAVRPALYVPITQGPTSRAALVLRASGDPAALSASVRRAVREFDATLAVAEVQPMGEIVATSVARPRFSALLLGAFAGCAVLLALVGIYGVVAQGVAQRSAEFGIRVALGARPADVRRDVLGGSLKRAGIGIALGLAGAAGLTRLMADQLYDTSPFDPGVLTSMSVLVALVAAAASWIPARRATRVSPMQVLRTD